MVNNLTSEIIVMGIKSLQAFVESVMGSLRLIESYLMRAKGEVQDELASMELRPEEVEKQKAIIEDIYAHIENL